MRVIGLALITALVGLAQTTVNGGRDYKGTLKASGSASAVDFSGAGNTAPVKTGLGASRPAACTAGQIYFATDASAGQNLWFCTTTGNPGTWSQMTGGGGGAVSSVAGKTGVVTLVPGDVGLGNVANTNTTNASNISSGVLPSGRLPMPTSSNGGGVQSKAAASHQFLTSINTDGSVSAGQPAASDVSGLAASATTDTTNAANITSGVLPDARHSSNVVMANGANSFSGFDDFSGATMRPPESTVASLPSAASVTGRVFVVTDASAAGSCSTGGGSTREVCRSNGSNYECIGNCGGGGGGAGNPGGSNGQMQYNSSGIFAGQPFVLSGSAFQRGVECATGTVSYSALTANATSQEVTIVTAVPQKFRFLHMIVQESTQFASASVGTVTVSAGRLGVDTDLIPAFGLKSASAPQNFWFDRPGTPVLGSGTYDLVLQFVGSNPLGNGSASNFTAGSVAWEVCGFAIP